jgi:predicted RNA methylase
MTESDFRRRYQPLLYEQGLAIKAAAEVGDARCGRIITAQHTLAKGWDEDAARTLITDLESFVDETRDVGWYPSPPSFARWLVALAGVMPGHEVLEPSAGEGAIVEALVAVGARVHAVERNGPRRAYMMRRAWPDVVVLHYEDFLEMPRGSFDRAVMNPPFARSGLGDHLDHVQHAYGMLRTGGELVAALPITAYRDPDERAFEFRDWAAHLGGEWLAVSDQPFAAKVIVLRITRP